MNHPRPFVSSVSAASAARLRYTIVAAALVLVATTALAGREPEEWDDLPQIYSISFTTTSIGFGGQYVLDRASGALREVSDEVFAKEFAGSIGAPASEKQKQNPDPERGLGVTLKTSIGAELVTHDAYCSEGMDEHHTLTMDGAPLKDSADECSSIACAEVVGDQLWLGTWYQGELGDFPGEGIVVQKLETGERLAGISTEQGLTGDLVRVIRLDPVGGNIWVATNEGINEIDRTFRVVRTLFFLQDLDPESGAPRIRLTPTKQESDPLATLFHELHVEDAKGFYDVATSIPVAIRQQFFSELDGEAYQLSSRVEEAFAPKEMNALVPFYIAAARSPGGEGRWYALSQLCSFNDPRVPEFFGEFTNEPASPGRSGEERAAHECLGKYMSLGVAPPEQKKALTDSLLAKERAALERRAHVDGGYSMDDVSEVVSSAKTMKEAGDLRGMDAINAYFQSIAGQRLDSSLCESVGHELLYDDEVIPAMIAGLENPSGGTASCGCHYFDMQMTFLPRRLDAKYARALLAAIERRAPGASPSAADMCVHAFRSQLADANVRQAFFKDVYPTLTPQQQALADRWGKEEPSGEQSGK